MPTLAVLGSGPKGIAIAAKARALAEQRIDVDLSVAGPNPPLHLPVLAGLAQGPGFPNLNCLGLLSDRILRPYVRSGPPDLIDRKEKARERSA